jgi:aminoglycoside 6'-N-acetyltransferase
MTDPAPSIAFRELALTDMPRLAAWLTDPDVAAWYGEGKPTVEQLTAKYADRIAGTDPTFGFIIRIGHHDAGYIQAYRIADHPDYARQMDVPPGAVGIDLFIGDAAFRNRGMSTPILQAFLDRIVFGMLNAPLAVIAPDPANKRAIRAYEKAGFTWIKTVHIDSPEEPDDSGDEYVMVRPAR